MPTFKFTDPSGKQYTVNGPEGATEQQAFQILQGQLANKTATPADQPGSLTSALAGVGKGVGTTALNLQEYVGKGLRGLGADSVGNWLVNDAESGKAKLAGELAPYKAAHPTAAGGGELGGEIAATLPVGGALAKGASMIPGLAAKAPGLVAAIRSGGFTTGQPTATTLAGQLANIGTRMAGGAITGGASAALINPDDAKAGAIVGGLLPPAILGTGKALNYTGKAVGSLVKPFTEAGQNEIAGGVLRRFSDGGPISLNANEIVPGSMPTLAEATGNAGLATLQRGARDVRPNAFVERELQNSGARNALFDQIAGDAGKLDFFRASREQAANELYGKALDQAAQQPTTPYIKGLVTQLVKRPSIDEARRVAQRWAIERGEKPSFDGNLRALHDMKLALDDKIAEAVRQGAGGEVKALEGTKQKLLTVMEKLSPDYAEARQTYAAMSQPINAMETLQGLRLTDARGNITLAKAKGALESLQRMMDAPGANAAKSVTPDQLAALNAIHEDLLRQSNVGLGRSIGSNTFQNFATDNILSTLGGNPLLKLANKAGVSGVLGQVGKLAYSGPNEAIKNRLVDMMLQPQLAAPYLSPRIPAPSLIDQALASPYSRALYLAAPASTSR